MTMNNYEEMWAKRNDDQQKELLSEWAEGDSPLPEGQLFFALNKMLILENDTLEKKYSNYLNKFVFKAKDQTQQLIHSLSTDNIRAFVLNALADDLIGNLSHIIYLKDRYPYLLLISPNFPKTKAMLSKIESILDDLKEVPISDKTSADDFNSYLKLVLSQKITDSSKRYLDDILKDKDQRNKVCELYRQVQERKKRNEVDTALYDQLCAITPDYLSSLNYMRENHKNAVFNNDLYLLLANFVEMKPSIKSNFFQNIQTVLKNNIVHDPENDEELQIHFLNITGLSEQVITEFVAYLFKSDPELGQKLYDKMKPDCALLGLFAIYTFKVADSMPKPSKIKEPNPVSKPIKSKEPDSVPKPTRSKEPDPVPKPIKSKEPDSVHKSTKSKEPAAVHSLANSKEQVSVERSASKSHVKSKVSELVQGSHPESSSKSKDSSSAELLTQHEDAKPVKADYFNATSWAFKLTVLSQAMSNTASNKISGEFKTALNKIAEHARKHLESDKTSTRAKEGQQKYAELVTVFNELEEIKSYSKEDALTQTRDILMVHLDRKPNNSDLLKNRGGFFGAYKTLSKCLSAVGFKHFKFNNRTAESTTDHLLISLLDAVNDELKALVPVVEI